MKTISKTLSIFALTLLAACAQRETQKEVLQEQLIHSQRPADSPDEIVNRAATTFANAPGLTMDQKERLRQIYTQVYMDSMKIRREIGQAKSLIFSTLARKDYNSWEISDLKKRVVKLDQQRLDIMFKALDDVQSVVGRGQDMEKFYKYFQEHELPRDIHDAHNDYQ
jgi:hypothetical protein